MTALDDYLTQPGPGADADRPERFVIDGPGKAEWAMRKLAALETCRAENVALADDEMARIVEWLDDVNGKLDREGDFFRGLLVGWHREQLAKQLADTGGRWDKIRTKSRSLPAGTIEARLVAPVPEYSDVDTTVAWLEANGYGQLVATKKQPDRKAIAAAVKAGVLVEAAGRLVDAETGEAVPGVTVEQIVDPLDHVTITIKPRGEAA